MLHHLAQPRQGQLSAGLGGPGLCFIARPKGRRCCSFDRLGWPGPGAGPGCERQQQQEEKERAFLSVFFSSLSLSLSLFLSLSLAIMTINVTTKTRMPVTTQLICVCNKTGALDSIVVVACQHHSRVVCHLCHNRDGRKGCTNHGHGHGGGFCAMAAATTIPSHGYGCCGGGC